MHTTTLTTTRFSIDDLTEDQMDKIMACCASCADSEIEDLVISFMSNRTENDYYASDTKGNTIEFELRKNR